MTTAQSAPFGDESWKPDIFNKFSSLSQKPTVTSRSGSSFKGDAEVVDQRSRKAKPFHSVSKFTLLLLTLLCALGFHYRVQLASFDIIAGLQHSFHAVSSRLRGQADSEGLSNPFSDNFTNLNLNRTSYVAFGDSYAAGMGTGETEGDGCRSGGFSYPKLIVSMLGNDTGFQNLPCSGAVVDDILSGGSQSQIDSWVNASTTDIATLTVGGNDIGFYNVLTACVVRVGGVFAGDCEKEILQANQTIHSEEFQSKLKTASHQIIEKANHSDFRLFVVGYPTFFNADQIDCDHVTFGFWNPHHNSGSQHDYSAAWLYKPLRTVLDSLVVDLNHVLSQTADAVQQDYENSEPARVTFVNPNIAFRAHRFCERDAEEPDSHREDTWFFLNGWDDIISNDTAPLTKPSPSPEIPEKRTTILPDPSTCRSDLADKGNHDWADLILCDVAIAYNDPSSDAHRFLDQHVQETNSDTVGTLEISWWVPTRAAKMFHPRTAGHQAMARLVMEALGS